MFKLLNKKGFTLVELMIVVVILGILVAIAVPIYSMVTRNAEKKTCQSNMRMIVGVCNQYFMEHENYDGLIPDGGYSDLSTATLPSEFTSKFDSLEIPHCPADGTYSLERSTVNNAVVIACSEHGGYRD